MSLGSLLIVFVLTALLCASPWLTAPFAMLERGVDWVARKPFAAGAIVFVVTFAIDMLPSLFGSVPVPNVHDEFAYLLAADTFAHGRLTNPPLPDDVWPSFETFHVIQRPTYASKFPVGQGMALAIGQRLGHPIIGAWLSAAAASVAIGWTARGWMPPRWAMFCGLLAAIHPAIFSWSQSYWGGAVAMIGGALLVGAARRATNLPPRASTGILFGAGLAILANSRPFEGLVLAVLVVIVMLVQLRSPRKGERLVRILPSAAMILLPVGAFMLYYNWRVTGDALTLPYTVHSRQYMAAPLFFWQKPPTPTPQYRHEILRQFYVGDELATYQRERSGSGFWRAVRDKLVLIWDTFINPYSGNSAAGAVGRPQPFWIFLLALPLVLRSRRSAWIPLALFIALPLLHFLMTPWFREQYLAPVLGCLFVVLTLCMRQLIRLRIRRWWIGRGVVVATTALILIGDFYWARDSNLAASSTLGNDRINLVKTIEAEPGKHLVLVRYGSHHPATFEWMNNPADLNHARVLFARWTDSDHAVLHRYFADRSMWLLEMNEPDARLTRLE